MPREEDMTRKLLRGLLTLVLTTAATWLANKLVDTILGPEEEEDGYIEDMAEAGRIGGNGR